MRERFLLSERHRFPSDMSNPLGVLSTIIGHSCSPTDLPPLRSLLNLTYPRVTFIQRAGKKLMHNFRIVAFHKVRCVPMSF